MSETVSAFEVAAIRERSEAYFSGLDKCFEPRRIEVDRRDLLDEIDRLRGFIERIWRAYDMGGYAPTNDAYREEEICTIFEDYDGR